MPSFVIVTQQKTKKLAGCMVDSLSPAFTWTRIKSSRHFLYSLDVEMIYTPRASHSFAARNSASVILYGLYSNLEIDLTLTAPDGPDDLNVKEGFSSGFNAELSSWVTKCRRVSDGIERLWKERFQLWNSHSILVHIVVGFCNVEDFIKSVLRFINAWVSRTNVQVKKKKLILSWIRR